MLIASLKSSRGSNFLNCLQRVIQYVKFLSVKKYFEIALIWCIFWETPNQLINPQAGKY